MTGLLRSLCAATCAVALNTAVVLLAADESKVIFPSGSSSSVPSPAPSGGGLGNVTLLVGAVLAAVGGWFVWRGRYASPLGRDVRSLTLSETRSLGNRQYLVVATYEDKKFLLGVCPGRIDLIAPLHDAPPVEKSRL
jgi:flagellar protein FliO/FliZ